MMDLSHSVERSLSAGIIVEVGDQKYRFLSKGQEFEVGDDIFEAKSTGVYMMLKRYPAGRKDQFEERWAHVGTLEEFRRDILPVEIERLGPDGRETLSVHLATVRALRRQDSRPDRGGVGIEIESDEDDCGPR
jgi:hypothetical protein